MFALALRLRTDAVDPLAGVGPQAGNKAGFALARERPENTGQLIVTLIDTLPIHLAVIGSGPRRGRR